MNVSGGFSLDVYPSDLYTFDDYFQNAVNRFNWIKTSLIANLGWEYRTPKIGYFYFGASYHRPFSHIMRDFVNYTGNGRDEGVFFDLSGNYLTLDFRYFFHEDPQKKRTKKKQESFRVKKPSQD